MKEQTPSSEIILNPDGSIYHLGLRPEHLPDIILTVGDPERVPQVSQYFDGLKLKVNRREFVSHIGTLAGKPIMVISSGMGTDNVEILLTELDILANYNLKSLQPKPLLRTLNIIRLGTSGTLHEDIPLDSLLVSRYAFGIDTLMQFYDYPRPDDWLIYGKALGEHLALSFEPYCAEAAPTLLEPFVNEMLVGHTLTCPGFYAPQGRSLRLPIRPPHLHERLRDFSFNGKRITNFEMETAGYYALGHALGHNMLSTNAIVANRATQKFSVQASKTIDRLIRTVLSKISGLD
ncbi:nucleoside phosphorylase [Porifericola rhodea]|uniref:nucleoside phosphorylase n=1 Tax=Porifericola rhodea TaxID=930972 RepID=UPI002666224F|nr:nucleoside phosphorylase [Porifericola rhodea]WKN30439.1 nucleoside phosphorylase [Porifericola rhodea]